MTDCSNVEIRELLPDLVSGTLSATDVARVEAHVATCAECANELAIVRTVRALRPRAVPVDVARIVASLPTVDASGRAARGKHDRESLAVGNAPRRSRFHVWRMAAAIGVVAIGGISLQVARHGGMALQDTGLLSDSVMQVASAPVAETAGVPAAGVPAAGVPTAGTGRQVAVSFGDLGDYTDDELQIILDRLEQWDGKTSTDPLPTLPLLPPGGTNR